MKKETHPKYQDVLFIDSASGLKFVCGSTIVADATETFQGVEYPVVYLSISSSSHPFFTGSKQLVDSEGRVEKFKKRFGTSAMQAQLEAQAKEGAPAPKAASEAKEVAAPKQPAKAAAKPAGKSAAKPAAKDQKKKAK